MTRLTVALSGDCMATRGALITSEPAAAELRELLRAADFAFTNLEVVPSDGRGHPVHNAAGGGGLIADSRVIDEIVDAGFTVLGCANNHALDMGVGGVLRTTELLNEKRVPFAGIGADLPAARRPSTSTGPAAAWPLSPAARPSCPGRKRLPRHRSCRAGRG